MYAFKQPKFTVKRVETNWWCWCSYVWN